jgi:hypothetical protein
MAAKCNRPAGYTYSIKGNSSPLTITFSCPLDPVMRSIKIRCGNTKALLNKKD